MAGIRDVNRDPVIHTSPSKPPEAAGYDSNDGNADLGAMGRRAGV